MKQLILDVIADTAKNFAYYDRKEDEELTSDQLQDAILEGVITLDEIAEAFRLGVIEEFGLEETMEE